MTIVSAVGLATIDDGTFADSDHEVRVPCMKTSVPEAGISELCWIQLLIPWLGSSRPWYGPQIARDQAFEIFHITRLPQSSHVVNNVSSEVDVASCR